MKNFIFAFVLMLVCAGCAMAPWVKTPEDEYRHSGLKVAATLPKEWMRFTRDKTITLTKDGTTLNIIAVSRIRFKDKLAYTKRKFTEDMTPLDLAEVEIDDLKSNEGNTRFEILNNKPVETAGQQAYYLEYTYESTSGLKVHGQQYGFIYDEHVYRVRFEATEQFYYQQTLKDFKQFIKSLRIFNVSLT